MAIYKHLKATRTNAFGVKSSVKSGLSNKRASIKGFIIFPIFLTTPTPYQQFFNTQSAEILTHFWPLPISSLPTSFMYAPNRSSFLYSFGANKLWKKEEIEEKELETMPNESHVCLFWHSPMVISAFANKPRYDERQNGSFLPARWLAGSKQ